MNGVDHQSAIDRDADGWIIAKCTCDWTFGPVPDDETATDVLMEHAYNTAGVELARLQQWKSEAIDVLAEWEKVWEAAGRPGRLGQSRAAAVLGELARLGSVVGNDDASSSRQIPEVSEARDA